MKNDNATPETKAPSYAAQLLMPRARANDDKRVWSIGLAATWIPFFTATNATGESAIPSEVLGAPIRLQKNQDGTPKFSKNGKPQLRVVKELNDQIRIIRENFVFGLTNYTEGIRKAMPAEFKAQVEANEKAGAPLAQADNDSVANYIAQLEQKAAVVSEAEQVAGEAGKKELVAA